MKPPPADWPRLSVSLFYDDAAAAIDFIVKAFDFTVRVKVEGAPGQIVHSELTYGEALIMVSDATKQDDGNGPRRASPRSVGGANTMALFFHVEDVEAHLARARAAGAVIVRELATSDYGEEWFVDRGYGCTDPEGHFWSFAQRLKDPPAKK